MIIYLMLASSLDKLVTRVRSELQCKTPLMGQGMIERNVAPQKGVCFMGLNFLYPPYFNL